MAGLATRESAERGARGGADPVTTQIVRHGLDAAADQMRVALCRTAFSPIIYEMTDFAAALYDPQVRLLAQGRALPLFLGTLGACVETAVKRLGGAEVLEPGDVIVTTYSYDTGSHAQDLTIVVPGFVDGEHVGYAAIKAHHLDLGARDPYCTDTTDLFQEGLILPGVRLYRAGVLQDDLYRTLLSNSRLPHALVGDLHAQIGAAEIGLAGLYRLIERYGLDQFRAYTERIFDHAEALARSFFGALPDGVYTSQGAMDNDGVNDEMIPFDVKVKIDGDRCVIDFTDAPDEVGGPINCPRATTVSACRMALMSFFDHAGSSPNEGLFRPIEILTRPGSLFEPLPPAPCFMYGWPAKAVIEHIHRALAPALPDRVPAGSARDLCAIVWWGTDENGEAWGDGCDHLVGHGASTHGDARSPFIIISCSGIKNTPVEVLEAKRPLLAERFEFVPDTGGAGKHRGGLGVEVHYRSLGDVHATLPWEQTLTGSWGLEGGLPGATSKLAMRAPDGTVEPLGKCSALVIPPGSVLQLLCGGGGGWGPPEERTLEAIESDIREGYVTAEAARQTYPQFAG
jgi:N-methylhydantoinase B